MGFPLHKPYLIQLICEDSSILGTFPTCLVKLGSDLVLKSLILYGDLFFRMLIFWSDMFTRCFLLGFTPRPPLKTNMTMEHPAFVDVFPVENGDFPMSC